VKIPVDWINEYLAKPLTTREIADALERAGVEVEEIISGTTLDPKIIVGEVKTLKPHPQADRLQVAEVDVKDATLQIVCGAANIATGQHVPVALVGASLPDGTVIKAANLRGVESQGMICSESELGISQDHAGIMVLANSTAIGSKVKDFISVSDVIDTTTAANRWDLNGIVWLAREVAAHANQKATIPEPKKQTKADGEVEVIVQDSNLVDHYMMVRLDVDLSKPSPDWLQQRLQAAGVRSINLVVDITNYCMLEYGQPLHAFDAAKVKLPITVRLAEQSETLVTLDDARRKLDRTDLVIADKEGPIGLAGVMGGSNSEIDADTTSIYLESASFNGPALRQTAIRHGLRTDASARFERRLPVELAPIVLARALQLFAELADGRPVSRVADHFQSPSVETHIVIDPKRISGFLGLKLTGEQIANELSKLEFELPADVSDLTVVPPWWRPDVQAEADVAEEIIKLVGYDQLPATLPAWAPKTISFDGVWPRRWQTVGVLRSLGLFEVLTYSFISNDQITSLGRTPDQHLKLKNPLSIEQAHLRTDLLPSLLKVAELNRTYGSRFGLFEISKVYHPRAAGELPDEPTHLAVLVRAETDGYREVKSALDRLSREFNIHLELQPGVEGEKAAHPTRSATISLGKAKIGWIGQLHPELVAPTKLGGEVGYLEIDWSQFIGAATPVVYRQPSRYPAVMRDISVVVDRQLTWQEVATALTDHHPIFVSDYYGSELPSDKKALALRLTFVSDTKTLTDADADAELKKVVHLLKERFQAELRA
jgi:phenylalanyl-tRNA synthetase beta chain